MCTNSSSLPSGVPRLAPLLAPLLALLRLPLFPLRHRFPDLKEFRQSYLNDVIGVAIEASEKLYPTPASPGDGIRGGRWIGACDIPWWKWWESCTQFQGATDCPNHGMEYTDRPKHRDGTKVFCTYKKEDVAAPTAGRRFTDQQRHLLSSAVLDSFVFAGGLSVASVISTALGVLYGKGQDSVRRANVNVDGTLGLNLDLMKEEDIQRLVWESARLYPGVVGFPIVPTTQNMADGAGGASSLPRSSPLDQIPSDNLANLATTDLSEHRHHRTAYLLAEALRDPTKWGDLVTEFRLKSTATYERYAGVAWADPATIRFTPGSSFPSSTGVDPDSRGCPAKDLSFKMSVAFFRALKDTTGAAAWEHADPADVTEDHGQANNEIEFIDVTPFLTPFVLKLKSAASGQDPSATVNTGAYGCTDDEDCMTINDRGVKKCFLPSKGSGKCLAKPGTLGANVVCYIDDECAPDGGEAANCKKSIVDSVGEWLDFMDILSDRPGVCEGRLSQTEVEAPLPEDKCSADYNPDTCTECTALTGSGGKNCAWCFAYKWSAGAGKCVKDAASCPAGSILYTSKAPVALFTDYTKPLTATFKSRSMSNGNAVEVQPFNLDTLDQCPSMVIESRYEDLKPYVMQAGGLFEQSVGGWMDKRFTEQTDTFNKQMYASCESARVKWLADLPTAAASVTNYEPKEKYVDGYKDEWYHFTKTNVVTADFGGIQVCDFDEDWEAMGLSERVGRTIFNMATNPEMADSGNDFFGDLEISSGASGSSGGSIDDSGRSLQCVGRDRAR